MAKARVSINPLYTGGAGGYSFYVRKDEQVVRQRKNNSNYGESASRSLAQQMRRVKWANLVNVFKACKSFMPKAYESKDKSRTDYNEFMSVNINSARVSLTKDQAANGCAVIDAFQISKGSLPPITLTTPISGEDAVSDIAITAAITSTTTIGALSADIIANNPTFIKGDNIALIAFSQMVDARQYPYMSPVYTELTLDPTNTDLLSTLEIYRFLSQTDTSHLSASLPGSSFGSFRAVVMIHTRMASPLLVSSQQVVMIDSSVTEQYIGYEWEQECIATYGLNQDAPLDPSFKYGTISSVTANSVEIRQGDILDGQQTVRVYGENLTSTNFKFIANNVEYYPLEKGNGYLLYSVTSDANITLLLNGRLYLSFRVDAGAPPSDMTGNISAYLEGVNAVVEPDSRRTTNSYCLNYPLMVNETYFRIRVVVKAAEGEVFEESDFTPHNCTISSFAFAEGTGNATIRIIPTDNNEVCYLIHDGYIIFVGNYS